METQCWLGLIVGAVEVVDGEVAPVAAVVNPRLLRRTCRGEPKKNPPADVEGENQGAAGGPGEGANLNTWSVYCLSRVYFR